MNRGHQGNSSAYSGFSLIEVLIALIVMSVGMLGIAGLYVHGLQAGRTSLFRHHAVALAGDIADRIRANPGGQAGYNDNAFTASLGTDCLLAVCTPAEMAGYDKYSWDQQARNTIPNGDVDVIYAASAASGQPAIYTVTIAWDEAGNQSSYRIDFPVFEPEP